MIHLIPTTQSNVAIVLVLVWNVDKWTSTTVSLRPSSFHGPMFWNWKNSFITSCTKEKIFNQWNDNIIHSLKRPIIYNLLCIYFVLVAASWSCKMSFDEGMARDTFVIKRFDVTEVVNGLNKNTTKEQKSNIFFHLYV